MSYVEYKDMFDKAQKHGKYQMFIIDLANSKKLSTEDLKDAEITMREKFDKIANYIEKKYGILHINNHPLFNNNKYFVLGDLCGICVESGSSKMIEKIIKKEFKNFDYKYHFETGFYDTDDWAKGNTLYYFGYCIQELERKYKKAKK